MIIQFKFNLNYLNKKWISLINDLLVFIKILYILCKPTVYASYSLLEIISKFAGAFKSGCLLSDFSYMINGVCLEDQACFVFFPRGNDYTAHSTRLIVRDSN